MQCKAINANVNFNRSYELYPKPLLLLCYSSSTKFFVLDYVTYEIVKKLHTEIRFFMVGLMGWIGSCYSPEKQNLVEKKGIL